MSKHDFSLDEFSGRRRQVRTAMDAIGIDWLVLTHPVSIHWLTGSDAKGYQAFQALLISTGDDRLRMFTRESERAEFEADALIDDLVTWGGPEPEDPIESFLRYVAALGLPRGRLGLEAPSFYLHPDHAERLKAALGSTLVTEAGTLVQDLKTVKSEREIAYVREAGRIADRSVAAMTRHLAAGRTESEIAAEIYREILACGGGIPATPVNFVSGPRSAFSHGAPTNRHLRNGDFGHAEYNVPYRRYGVSIGRHFAIGDPGPRARELHALVREAADTAIAEIREGVSAHIPHQAAKRVIAGAGLDRFRVHVTGYGLAPAFPPATAEPVQLFGGSTASLKAGMTLSVCPSIFIGQEGIGARLVDTVIVTPTGAEMISKVPRDLILVE
jgi:Xaa-Pro dipeptidase